VFSLRSVCNYVWSWEEMKDLAFYLFAFAEPQRNKVIIRKVF
jgi:hypothetical protein